MDQSQNPYHHPSHRRLVWYVEEDLLLIEVGLRLVYTELLPVEADLLYGEADLLYGEADLLYGEYQAVLHFVDEEVLRVATITTRQVEERKIEQNVNEAILSVSIQNAVDNI